jgi:hypothetical protein
LPLPHSEAMTAAATVADAVSASSRAMTKSGLAILVAMF